MSKSVFQKGQKLDAVFCPEMDDGSNSGAAVGHDQVTDIEVAQACGPMGFYDVAVIRRDTSRPDEIIPLHMAEYVRLAPTS